MTKRPKNQSIVEPTTGAMFGLQALAGFLLGGLTSITLAMAPALWSDSPESSPIRFLGYIVGGALGGACLVWGYPKRRVLGAAALGFGGAFLIPAFVAGAAIDALMKVEAADYGAGVVISTFFAYSISFGIAGGLGMALTIARMFWKTTWVFFAAGGIGGVLASIGPGLGGAGDLVTAYRTLVFLLAGHVTAFGLAGYGTGKLIERDLRRPARDRR